MTILIDRAPGSARTAHVLIVGVGAYDGGQHDTIVGMAATIGRLYDWWKDVGADRLPEGVSLGTVSVVLSPDTPRPFRDDADQAVTPEAATSANVKEAFEAWLDRVGSGCMGFLYWCGHGAMPGRGNSSSRLALFCQDQKGRADQPSWERPQAGYDWTQTLHALNVKANGSRVSCFIDCCKYGAAQMKYPAMTDHYHEEGPHDVAYVQYSAAEGFGAPSFARAIPQIEFDGGPLGTNAVLDAFDRYGCDSSGAAGPYPASASSIRRESKLRAARIASWIGASVKSPKFTGQFPDWEDEPLVRIMHPSAMIDIHPSSQNTSSLDCEIVPHPGTPLARRPGHWEATAAHGAHEVRLRRQGHRSAFHVQRFEVQRSQSILVPHSEGGE